MPVKEKKQVFQVKDISNDGVIKKVKENAEAIKIKTETEKHIQNKNFVKTNDIKENSYKEKVIGEKQISTSNSNNNNNNLSTVKNEPKYNNVEENKQTKVKNNRHSLSSRVLRGSEYVLDQVLSGDDEDLGIDTIIKAKRGIKASASLSKKNLEVSKRVGKKVYKVATSESAKSFYAGTINTSKMVYEKSMDISTKVYVRQKVKSYLKANSLKERQKRELKKKMKQKAKEKLENGAYMISKILVFYFFPVLLLKLLHL